MLLVAVAAWLGMGGGKERAPAGGIEAEIAGPDAAEKVWTRRSEARLGGIETQIREMQQEARRLGADNDRLRAKLEGDAANAREVIDRQAALIDELGRGMQPPAHAGAAPGTAPGSGEYFRAPGNAAPGGDGRPAAPVPGRMIETFELDGAPQSSATRSPSGPELVAEALAKPVSVWLPAGAHAEAVVLAGVDASAGVSSQGDPRPVLLRIIGPAWTAAPSGSEDGTAMQVDVDGCTVTGAAHGDLSSEKVYVRLPHHDLRRAGARHRGTPWCGGRDRGRGVRRGLGQDRGARTGGEPRGRAGREGVPRRPRLGARPGRRPGVPAPGGRDRDGRRRSPTPGLATSAGRVLGAGASSAGQKVADYMIRRAEQYQPVVQLQAGTKVTLVFLEGARIDGRAPRTSAQTQSDQQGT